MASTVIPSPEETQSFQYQSFPSDVLHKEEPGFGLLKSRFSLPFLIKDRPSKEIGKGDRETNALPMVSYRWGYRNFGRRTNV